MNESIVPDNETYKLVGGRRIKMIYVRDRQRLGEPTYAKGRVETSSIRYSFISPFKSTVYSFAAVSLSDLSSQSHFQPETSKWNMQPDMHQRQKAQLFIADQYESLFHMRFF